MEAAIHAGIPWDHYKEIDTFTQAEIITHCLEARSREAYEMEKATDEAGANKPDGTGEASKMTAEDYSRAIMARVVSGKPMTTLAGRHDPPKSPFRR